jgi:hypothetical protein
MYSNFIFNEATKQNRTNENHEKILFAYVIITFKFK